MKLISLIVSVAALLIALASPAMAAPAASAKALSCTMGAASASPNAQCAAARHGPLAALLLPVRDIRSAGGNGNGCWSACFTDFDECMGIRTKNLCVSRVKTCLETCERLSNRPSM